MWHSRAHTQVERTNTTPTSLAISISSSTSLKKKYIFKKTEHAGTSKSSQKILIKDKQQQRLICFTCASIYRKMKESANQNRIDRLKWQQPNTKEEEEEEKKKRVWWQCTVVSNRYFLVSTINRGKHDLKMADIIHLPDSLGNVCRFLLIFPLENKKKDKKKKKIEETSSGYVCWHHHQQPHIHTYKQCGKRKPKSAVGVTQLFFFFFFFPPYCTTTNPSRNPSNSVIGASFSPHFFCHRQR